MLGFSPLRSYTLPPAGTIVYPVGLVHLWTTAKNATCLQLWQTHRFFLELSPYNFELNESRGSFWPIRRSHASWTLPMERAWASGAGHGSPTQRSTTRNSSSGSPNVFSGSSSTLSRLPLEQYSMISTFCRLPPCAGTRGWDGVGEEGTSHCPEVAYLEPAALIFGFLLGLLVVPQTHLRHRNQPKTTFSEKPSLIGH